jgi:dethiobiotin synthetase/adenosylmethionine--8-amino-7-oxononanoate aminotransferase
VSNLQPERRYGADKYSSDPLFQRVLVQTVRNYEFAGTSIHSDENPNVWTGLPVMFDEVFTGLYRLGHFSAASLLQIHPDISIHAKLLTGGLLPLSTTLASNSIFEAFLGDEKADALLHGHSYTAHPIGCHVANTSLHAMEQLRTSYTWIKSRKDWEPGLLKAALGSNPFNAAKETETLWSFWSKDTVTKLSHHVKVDHVIAIGSVLAVSLKDQSGSGKSHYHQPFYLSTRTLLANWTFP